MKLLKKVITVLLALLMFLGSLFYESGLNANLVLARQEVVRVTPSKDGAVLSHDGQTRLLKAAADFLPGDSILTNQTQTAVINFEQNALIRMAPDSKLVYSGKDGGHSLLLEKGRIWVNNYYADVNFNIRVGSTVFVPSKASFDLNFDGDNTTVKVFNNQVRVNILDDGLKAASNFLLVQGAQIQFTQSKIKENLELLKKLFYSKLIKEFQYSVVDQVLWQQDQWLVQNINDDQELLKTISQNRLNLINQRNLKYASLDSIGFQVQKGWTRFANAVTLFEDKLLARTVNAVFDQLEDAEYLLVFTRNSEARERLSIFRQSFENSWNNGSEVYRNLVLDTLKLSYWELNHVLPDDPLFQVKSEIVEFLFKYLGHGQQFIPQKIVLLHDYINYVYQFASSNQSLAKTEFSDYFNHLKSLLESEKVSFDKSPNFLAEENQILDNLFRQYSQFYLDDFFAIKHFLENELLLRLGDVEQRNEQKQNIISTKIDFLKQLQEFFLNEKVTVKDAKMVAFRLISEIKDLQTNSQIAVSELFELRLKDYGQFLRFLSSVGVNGFTSGTLKNRYEKFLAKQNETVSIEQAAAELAGEQNFQQGAPVELQVKRSKEENISQMTTEETQADNASQSFTQSSNQSSTQTLTQSQQQTQQAVSKSDRVAKILLVQKLKSNGILTKEENIEIKDKENGIFLIKDASLADLQDLTVIFTLQNKDNVVVSVHVKFGDEEKILAGNMALADLNAKLMDFYNSKTDN